MRVPLSSVLVLLVAFAAPCLAQHGEHVSRDLPEAQTGKVDRVLVTLPATAGRSFVLSLDTILNARLWRDQGFRFGLRGDTPDSRGISCAMKFKRQRQEEWIAVDGEVTFFSFMAKNKDKDKPDVPVSLGEKVHGRVDPSTFASTPCNWAIQYSARLRSFRILLRADGADLFDSGWRRLYQEEMSFTKFFFVAEGFKKDKDGGGTFEATDHGSLEFRHGKKSILSVKNLDLRQTAEF